MKIKNRQFHKNNRITSAPAPKAPVESFLSPRSPVICIRRKAHEKVLQGHSKGKIQKP